MNSKSVEMVIMPLAIHIRLGLGVKYYHTQALIVGFVFLPLNNCY